jgi:hypothetical protein
VSLLLCVLLIRVIIHGDGLIRVIHSVMTIRVIIANPISQLSFLLLLLWYINALHVFDELAW